MGIRTTKSVARLIADSDASEMHRALGPGALVLLGIGAVIGAGIFVFTGPVAAENTGPGLILSILLAALACAFSGICYAELASMIPVAGSAYTYAYATIGELVAWIIGWDLILEYSISSASVAVGWAANFVSLLGDAGIHIPAALTLGPGQTLAMNGGGAVHGIFNVPAAIIVLVITWLLVVGVKESAHANAAIVVVKVGVLALFVIAAIPHVHTSLWHPLVPANTGEFGHYGWSGIVRGAGIIFFAYIGFDAVSTAAQEAKNPQRDMPIGILGSLLVCTVVYVAVALALTGVVRYSKLDVADPINVGIAAMGVTWLGPIVKVGALLGLFSVILVNLLAQPRIFYSMSRDGLLPPMFGKIHPRYGTPHLTTMVTGVIVAIAAGIFPITVLGQLVSMGTLLAFVLVCAGVIILRRTDPDRERPFRTPGTPWVPAMGILVCLYLMSGLPATTWVRLVVWLVIGFAIYFGYGHRRAAVVRETQAARRAAA